MKNFLYSQDIAIFAPHREVLFGSSPAIQLNLRSEIKVSEDWPWVPQFSRTLKPYISLPTVNHEGTFPARQRTSFGPFKNFDFYGCGEQLGKLRKNGEVLPVFNRDNFIYEQGNNLYQAQPWVMALGPNGECVGFLADTTYRGEIDLSDDRVVFEFEGVAHRVLVIKSLNPQGLMEKLAELTGKISLPPIWALGYQQCRYSYMNEHEIKSIINNFRDRKLPCDVIWFDIDYMDGYRVFSFDKEAFPSPKSINEYAHENNFKTVWMIDPGVKVDKDYKIFSELSSKELYVKYFNDKESSAHELEVKLDVSSNKEHAKKLINGKMDDSWVPAVDDHEPSIILDLGSLSEILHIDLYWRGDYPPHYKVDVSIDGKHWRHFGKGEGHISGGHHCFWSPAQMQMRYIRLNYGNVKEIYALDQIMLNGQPFHELEDIAPEDMFVGNVWPGRCGFPDFTRKDTCDWWAGLYPSFVGCGIDGVWNDMNEPAVFGGGPQMTMPDKARHSGGLELNGEILKEGDHSEYHNIYGMLMARATREGMLKAYPNRRPFVLTRANYIGGQRYAATWTGDNASSVKHMKLATPMTLNLSLSGQPFVGPDLGGFAGQAKGELFARWMSVGSFYPFMRGHASKGTNQKEPWAFGEEVEDSCRISLQRRYRLIPYIYNQFYLAAEKGLPIMRPLFFADPANRRLRRDEDRFLLGEDLLIVPDWSRAKVLPKGGWKRVSLVEGDLEDKYQPAVYLREGAILALADSAESTSQLKGLSHLIINPDKEGNAEAEMYSDSGEGWAHLKGEFELLKFKYSQGNLSTNCKTIQTCSVLSFKNDSYNL